MRQNLNTHISRLKSDYSSSNLNLDRFLPKDKPFDLTRSWISVNDFLPKFLNFNISATSYDTKSARLRISAALRQFNARTDRSRSTNSVFRVFRMCKISLS